MIEKHATRVPTVLIGIGGIGGQIVRLVNKSLKKYDKQFVEMVVLDTNTNDLSKSQVENITLVQTSENMTVSDYLRQNSRFQEWFPVNPLINAKNLTQGAGQIRSVSRLGALASEASHRFDTIRKAIENVNENVGDNLHNMIRVMIVGSICGGTGSGMGIQLPFLIRDTIEEIAHMPRTIIRGLFLMPDIVEEVQDTNEKKKSVYVNGYAFLRELNAFNKAQTFQKGTEKLDIEHYNRDSKEFSDDPTQMSHQIPYDFLFLLEKSNVHGQNIGGFDAYVSKAAQIVKIQLFASDMTADLLSTEDNLIVSAVNRQGMNRFCGAGISKAVYPEEENLRYCALRFSEKVLQSYWLRVDHMVAVNMAQHRRQMATDHSLMPKDPQEEFINVFDEITDPTRFDVTSEMGQLKRELVYEAVISDENGNDKIETVNIAEGLFSAIDVHLEERYKSEELRIAGDESKMKVKKLSSNNGISYCETQLQKLRNFEKTVKEHVGKITAGAIDAILSADKASLQIYGDSANHPYNISSCINKKHPIASRYILYYVKKRIKESLVQIDAVIFNYNEMPTIFNKDYYKEKTKDGTKDTTKDDPVSALTRTRQGFLSPLGLKSGEYNNLVKDIVRDSGAFVQRTTVLYENKFKKSVFETVLKRLDYLIEVYEDFFNALEQIRLQNYADIEILEDDRDRIQNSDIYVCSDSYCKKWLYDKFSSNLSGVDTDLPEAVKGTFFDVVFNEYVNKYNIAVDNTAITSKPLSMKELFESAILKPLTEKYEDREMSHVKMDIITAIKKEHQIHSQNHVLRVNGELVDAGDYDDDQYFESIAMQLKQLSAPYLSYSAVSEEVNNILTANPDMYEDEPGFDDETIPQSSEQTNGRVLCCWGINDTAVAKHQHKDDTENVDRDSLRKMFGNSNGETYYVINDDSFDSKELICYSAVYDFFVENLDKYGKNSRAYKEYSSRILRVIKSDFNVGTGVSSYLDTVHPHLDRRWHSHSYLPMLHIEEELEEQKRIAKAFLLGIASCRIWYMEIDTVTGWSFRVSGQKSIKSLTFQGEPACRASFYTLFKVLDENTVAVNDILKQIAKDERNKYEDVPVDGITVSDILKHPIIDGFIGDVYSDNELADLKKVFDSILSGEKGKKPINILRVIYSVYKDSHDIELVSKLIYNLTEYLNYYCLKMANRQKGVAKTMFEAVAKAIGKNFKCSKVNREFTMLCEEYL